MVFSLHSNIPVAELRTRFQERGRIEIAPFLDRQSSDALRAHLLGRRDWRFVLNAGEEVFEIERQAFRELEDDKRAVLEKLVLERARNSFQYRFETIRVPDETMNRRASGTLLDDFADFMGSPEALEVFRSVTGMDDISFADAQATIYGPGDFLTRHDDDVAGKNRRAAYVLGLTPRWKSEWGGLLMFHAADENIEEAFAPAMGKLRLFTVPAQHSVSYVSPIAPEPRLSITGWLRALPG